MISAYSVYGLYQIESKVEDQKVVITNVGNVDYENITSTYIYKENLERIIYTRVSLHPQESYEIGLSKEVAEGVYTLILPTGEMVYDVYIEDNRSIAKKTSAGLITITGYIARNIEKPSPWSLASLVLFVVIVVVLAFFEYIGVPVLSPIKNRATKMSKKAATIYKKFKKK